MQTGNFNSALPILSLYVFAGYRLMPALQQVYASFTNITFIIPSLDKIYEDLKGQARTCFQLTVGFSFFWVLISNDIFWNGPIRIGWLVRTFPCSQFSRSSFFAQKTSRRS